MTLLIDTHILLWLLNDDPQLGTKSRALITDGNQALTVSYFSLFELRLKELTGKLHIDRNIIQDLTTLNIDLIMPTTEDIERMTIYNPQNKDPLDNLLITIAVQHAYTLITSDHQILAATVPKLKLLDGRK